ncbi:hypothetical protein ATE67_08755 [Sphingopyxis sp. H050]|jgi:hypothetical protein|uniref:hypothetical protein n=1 Tax=Sphingopyxis sp. H050 TaxID=1759072 RepID=UPI000736C19F|nr:hypothetical protein [Sphingopyxis sp. H050]KTE21370.1 hypothetical protein ATE67_08755 [Sphingopyxis sp. H050]
MAMNKLTKAAIGAATAGAVVMSATPAMARDRYDRDGISAGEVIAGAVVLGGLAAILSSGNDRDRYDDRYGRYDDRYDRGRYDNDPRYGYGYDYNRYGNSRAAVSQCVSAVERGTSRYGRTDVTQVTSIDRKRDGYRVKGRVVVTDGYGGRWGRGGSYDKGKFSCDIRYGRVQDISYSGLR